MYILYDAMHLEKEKHDHYFRLKKCQAFRVKKIKKQDKKCGFTHC